jgi:hypothetical protein
MLLRLRRKPPAGIPNINSGTPWTAMDVADLEDLLRDRTPVAEIAEFLCRDVEEVEAKIAERWG